MPERFLAPPLPTMPEASPPDNGAPPEPSNEQDAPATPRKEKKPSLQSRKKEIEKQLTDLKKELGGVQKELRKDESSPEPKPSCFGRFFGGGGGKEKRKSKGSADDAGTTGPEVPQQASSPRAMPSSPRTERQTRLSFLGAGGGEGLPMPHGNYAFSLAFAMQMVQILWPNAEKAFCKKVQREIIPGAIPKLPPDFQDLKVRRIQLGHKRPVFGPLRLCPPAYEKSEQGPGGLGGMSAVSLLPTGLSGSSGVGGGSSRPRAVGFASEGNHRKETSSSGEGAEAAALANGSSSSSSNSSSFSGRGHAGQFTTGAPHAGAGQFTTGAPRPGAHPWVEYQPLGGIATPDRPLGGIAPPDQSFSPLGGIATVREAESENDF